MNSSSGLLHCDPFDIIEECRLFVPFPGTSTTSTNSTHESIGSRSTLVEYIDTLTCSTNNHWPESSLTFLPQWDAKTIEVVGLDCRDASIG